MRVVLTTMNLSTEEETRYKLTFAKKIADSSKHWIGDMNCFEIYNQWSEELNCHLMWFQNWRLWM